MTNKMVRPIMTVEARDALDRMTANYELRSSGIVVLESEFNEMQTRIDIKNLAISKLDGACKYYRRKMHQNKESRDYWLKVAGVSIAINWAFLVYVVVSEGWLL